MRMLVTIVLAVGIMMPPAWAAAVQRGPAGPQLVIESAKGTIEVVLFQQDAPKSVAHLLGLVKRNFYRGQRIHRVERTLVQFGDQVSRDMSRRDWWGRAGSGTPIGVAEFSKRSHTRGAVSLAHSGNPSNADSQLFIVKVASAGLDGKHVIVGQVTRGMDVVDRLQVADLLKSVTLR
jgi:cyclophilin family peptidyl-prolyl cis-trans isomerase